MSDAVYRSVNKYVNYSTMEEKEVRYKVYDTPAKARSYATLYRYSRYGGTHSPWTFVETWCERATQWDRIS